MAACGGLHGAWTRAARVARIVDATIAWRGLHVLARMARLAYSLARVDCVARMAAPRFMDGVAHGSHGPFGPHGMARMARVAWLA